MGLPVQSQLKYWGIASGVFLVTLWCLCIADVFDDERAVGTINIWIGTISVIFLDARSGKKLAAFNFAITITTLGWLATVLSVHYGFFSYGTV